jgi:CxxC motif-containing protein (DUF1111 family)
MQLFGLGLIESIQDSAIRANMNADHDLKRSLGISGHPNMVPNNGTISRFAWKAQNGSLTIVGQLTASLWGIQRRSVHIADARCNASRCAVYRSGNTCANRGFHHLQEFNLHHNFGPAPKRIS